MRKYFLLLILVIASTAHAASSFTFDSKRGPFPVGFRAVFQYDESRRYIIAANGQATARPIQTLIWYPAKTSQTPMTYGEYFEFGVNREKFDMTAEETKQAARKLLKDFRWKDEQIAMEESREQWASRNAAPATGKFPVVIYAPSLRGPAYENADLCEYLASQGYVVLASPSQGVDNKGMTNNRPGIDAQVGDIHFLINYAATIGEADTTRVGIVGFSWGGLSNAFAAVGKSNVRALVFLDGSIRYYPKIVQDSNLNGGERFEIPMLYFSQRPPPFVDAQAKVDVGNKFLARLTRANFYLATLNYMSHQDYASLFIREFGRGSYAAATAEEVSASYGLMARYVNEFLNASLKGDKTSQAFMARPSTANKVPEGLMSTVIFHDR